MFLACFLRSCGRKMNDYTHPSAALRQRPLVLCCSVVRWHHKLLAWIKSALRDEILSAVHFKICAASLSIHRTLSACLSVYLQLIGISAWPTHCSWLSQWKFFEKNKTTWFEREEVPLYPKTCPRSLDKEPNGALLFRLKCQPAQKALNNRAVAVYLTV